MGGLRRPSPQPQSNDPSLSIVDAATASLSNLESEPITNDKFFLDTAHLDFDTPIQTRPNPNHVDQRGKIHRSQNTSSYQQQPWEPHTASNGSNFSPQAFEVADELGITTSAPPETYAARRKHARPLGVGKYVQRIIELNKLRQQGMLEGSYEAHWKTLIPSFFIPGATLHIDLKQNEILVPRSVKVPVELMPRLWKAKVDAGLKEERMLLENPCEFQYPNGAVEVDCPRTLIISAYPDRTIYTDGYLRVTFQGDRKIAVWQFSTKQHTEMFTRTHVHAASNLRPRMDLGMPVAVVRMLYIATDIHQLKDRMNDEITSLLSNPQRMQGLHSLISPSIKREVPVKNRPVAPAVQNGNAFKTLSSVVEGSQLGQSRGGSLGIPMQSGETAAGARLSGDLNMDLKGDLQGESNIVPNLGEPLNALRSDPSQAMMSFHEAMRQPYMAGNAQNVPSSGGHNHGDLNLKPRKAASGVADGRISQTRHGNVIDAVNAVASGQGSWGMSAPNGHGMGGNVGGGEDLERNLQLLSAPQGNFSGRQDSTAGQRASVQGHNAPPGLKIFSPQTNQSGQESEQQPRRGRGSTGSRGAGSVRGRAAAAGQGMKGRGSVRAIHLQRVNSAKSKQGAIIEARHNGGGGGNHGNFVGTSQGLTDQNIVGNIANNSRAESVKPQNERQLGNRRPPQRTSSTDERPDKRQKSSTQNG